MRKVSYIDGVKTVSDMTTEEEQELLSTQAPPPPAILDQRADLATQRLFNNDPETTAIGLVIADVIEKAFGVSKAVARQQVKDRFQTYYRNLIS